MLPNSYLYSCGEIESCNILMRAKTLHLIYTLLKVDVYYIIILLAFGVLDTISVFKPIRCPILLPLTCNLGAWQFAVRAITSFLYTQVL